MDMQNGSTAAPGAGSAPETVTFSAALTNEDCDRMAAEMQAGRESSDFRRRLALKVLTKSREQIEAIARDTPEVFEELAVSVAHEMDLNESFGALLVAAHARLGIVGYDRVLAECHAADDEPEPPEEQEADEQAPTNGGMPA